jgi:hypothetical protein
MKGKRDASDVIFVLCAGASATLDMPTTGSLSEKLCDGTPEGRAAAEIYRSAAYRFHVSEKDINIEDFLEHLYELQSMLWLARRGSLPRLLPGFTASASIPAAADDMLRTLNRRVYQPLHETCGDCSGRKVETLWRPILKCSSGRQAVVPIFTLNYDWTFVERADFQTGKE